MATEMRKTNKSTVSDNSDTVLNKKQNDINKENEQLSKKVEELQALVEKLMENKQNNNQQFTVYSSKMDKPCTLIHFCECSEGLPNTIWVNGNTYQFSKFGEKRQFRFADMQQIVSKYRNLFERGLFMLGEDCKDNYEDFGIDVMNFPMSIQQHKKMAEISLEDFKSIIDKLNSNQSALIADAWYRRFERGERGYNNIEKIKILNKKTDGLLNTLIEKIYKE